MSENDWRDNILNTEERVKELLQTARIIAVVGMKDVPYKASYYVPKYMLDRGYRIIPVNPNYEEIEGMTCYPDLRSLPEPVDIVQVFRRSEDVPPHAEEAIAIRPRAFWMQSGIVNDRAAEKLARSGILVVMDRCMYVDHREFFGR